MTDRGSHGPSTDIHPDDDASDTEGPPPGNRQDFRDNHTLELEGPPTGDHQNFGDNADYFSLDEAWNPNLIALSEQNYDWSGGTELDRFLSQANQLPDELPLYSLPQGSTQCRTLMAEEVELERSFNCPYRVAQARLRRLPHTCTGLEAKNMAAVRRHLTRELRGKKPPHLQFLKLCPTCNEDFLDRVEFERDHGNEGEQCTTPRRQRKGDIGQQQQWNALYTKVEDLIVAESDRNPDAALTLEFVPRSSQPFQSSHTQQVSFAERSAPSNFETPGLGDIQHVGTWLDRSMNFDPSHDNSRFTLHHDSSEQIEHDGSRTLDDIQIQCDEPRDMRMRIANLMHRSNETDTSHTSNSERVEQHVSSLEEMHADMWGNTMEIDGRRDLCQSVSECSIESGYHLERGIPPGENLPFWPRPVSRSPPYAQESRSPRLLDYFANDDVPRSTQDIPSSIPIVNVSNYNSSTEVHQRWVSAFISNVRDGEVVSISDPSRSSNNRLKVPEDCGPSSPTFSDMSMTSSNLLEVLECETPGCDATFTGVYCRGNLARHKRESHSQIQGQEETYHSSMSIAPSNNAEVLACEISGCYATFTGSYRRGNLQRHMRLKHGQIQRYYPCEAEGCSKNFNRQDARLKHYRKRHPHRAPGPALSRKIFSSV